MSETKSDTSKPEILPVTISVRYPEFLDNMEKLYAMPHLCEAVKRCCRGYGVNRSTVIQYLVQKEIDSNGK